MALWLEADRMASFKVSEDVLKTERNVVKEEWRLRYANQPYGAMTSDLLSTAFTKHNYRWTPIGDMDQLAAAKAEELQAFHERYYVPNNACLIIAGSFDVSEAKEYVKKYYGWIPRGKEIVRVAQPEPVQTEYREKIVTRPDVRVTRTMMAYKSPDYRSDDNLGTPELRRAAVLGGHLQHVARDLRPHNNGAHNQQLQHSWAVELHILVTPT